MDLVRFCILFVLAANSPLSVLQASAQNQQLIAHWRFDESAGNVATDDVGRYPGQLSPTGVTRLTEGVSGKALEFSRANNGFVDLGLVLPLADTPFSISGWVRVPAGDLSPVAGILTKHRPGTSNGYGVLFNEFYALDGADRIGVFIGDYGTVEASSFPTSTAAVNDGQWHHFVVSYDPANQIKLYVDGAPPDRAYPALSPTPTPARTVIGGVDTGVPQGTFNGSIDDVQIYGFALVDRDVDFLFKNPGTPLGTDPEPIQIIPGGGTFAGTVRVTLRSGIQGAELRYTLDESDPVATSNPYLEALNITPPATLKARAFVNGSPVSDLATARYALERDVRIQPPGGSFTNFVDIRITNRVAGAVVRYTLDGSAPKSDSPIANAPIRLSRSIVVQARAFIGEFPVSLVEVATFVRLFPSNEGIPDSWREQYFGPEFLRDPQSIAAADPDGDGSNNLQEFLVGTNPVDPLSGFDVGIRAVPEIRFKSVVGQTYRILRRASLLGSTPEVIATVTATGTNTVHLDHDVSNVRGFYVIEPVR